MRLKHGGRVKMDFDNWIDENIYPLQEDFLNNRLDEWISEDEAMDLLQSHVFTEYCEEKFEEYNLKQKSKEV